MSEANTITPTIQYKNQYYLTNKYKANKYVNLPIDMIVCAKNLVVNKHRPRIQATTCTSTTLKLTHTIIGALLIEIRISPPKAVTMCRNTFGCLYDLDTLHVVNKYNQACKTKNLN